MNAAHKAPTLAWLLTALACFLVGLAVGEGLNQAVALPHPEGTRLPVGVVVTVEVVFQPTATAEPIPSPTPIPRRPLESTRQSGT